MKVADLVPGEVYYVSGSAYGYNLVFETMTSPITALMYSEYESTNVRTGEPESRRRYRHVSISRIEPPRPEDQIEGGTSAYRRRRARKAR